MKTITWILSFGVLAIGLISVGAFDRLKQINEPKPKQQAGTITWTDSVIPTADGAAYAVTSDGVYYLTGPSSVLVSGMPDAGTLTVVIPLVDGAAYAATIDNVYYLKGASATKVGVGDRPLPLSGAQGKTFFSQWASEIGKADKEAKAAAMLSGPRYDY